MAHGLCCMWEVIVDTKINFLGPNGSGMGRMDRSSPNRVQAYKNRPMKRSKDIYGIFKKNSKLVTENIKTLSQRQNMEEAFSPSQDMAKDVGSYLKGGSLLGSKTP